MISVTNDGDLHALAGPQRVQSAVKSFGQDHQRAGSSRTAASPVGLAAALLLALRLVLGPVLVAERLEEHPLVLLLLDHVPAHPARAGGVERGEAARRFALDAGL